MAEVITSVGKGIIQTSALARTSSVCLDVHSLRTLPVGCVVASLTLATLCPLGRAHAKIHTHAEIHTHVGSYGNFHITRAGAPG